MYVHRDDHDRVGAHDHDRDRLLYVSGRCSKGVRERPNHLHQVEAGVNLGLDHYFGYHRVYVHRDDHDRVGAHGHGHARRGGHCRVDVRDHLLNLNPSDAMCVSMDPTCNAIL